jgi:hypothetical protein
MATLRARRSSRTPLTIRLTMLAVSVIFGETRPKKQSLESIGCGTQVSIQIPAEPNHFFRYGLFVARVRRFKCVDSRQV